MVQAQSFMDQQDFVKANSKWNFGENAGLDFGSGTPVPINSPGYGYQSRGCASVASRQTGDLLFYTDGLNCYNSNHTVMPNGNDLIADPFADVGIQGVCVVPFPQDTDKYYLFHMKSEMDGGGGIGMGGGTVQHYLYYSIVDMSLNGGLGDVVAGSKGLLIDSSLTGSVIAVPGNNCDIWVLTHSTSKPDVFENPYFKAFHITAAGIQFPAVVSTITGSHIATAFPPPPTIPGLPAPQAYLHSNMQISPNREMLALGIWNGDFGALYPDGPIGYVTNFNLPPMDMTSNNPGTTIEHPAAGLLTYKFDATTGIVSDEIFVRNLGAVGGVCFSPDNSKLYANLQGPVNCLLVNCSGPNDYRAGSTISQYDMTTWDSAAIVSSKFDIFSSASKGDLEVFSFRLYRNKIYFSRYGDFNHIGRINNPNLAGAACGYQEAAITLLPGTNLYDQFPNQVVFPTQDTFTSARDTVICGKMDDIILQADPSGYDFLWDNGSNASSRTVTARGQYWVRYRKNCTYRIDSIYVGGIDGEDLHIAHDSVNCHGEALLSTSAQATDYLWSTGATGSSTTVKESGKYWLRILQDGCTFSDTAEIVVIDIRQDLGDDIALCAGDPVNVLLKAHVPAGATVLWSTGAGSPQLQVADTGTFYVTVSYPPCSGSDTVKVSREVCDCDMGLPNAFSPNGDGLNDIFLPVIPSDCDLVRHYEMSVYNRYGERIFTSQNIGKGWDGRYSNGDPADAGTYFYNIYFTGGTRGKEKHRKGDITLVR